jgi:hypothetical protein
MKPKRNIVERITEFLPGGHERFREMCSMAAVGQLGGPQMCELNEHVATCESCREFLESVAQASVQFLPVLAEDRISTADVMPPAGMRSRFLSRLARERLEGLGDRLQVVGKGEGNYREEESLAEAQELVFQRVVPSNIGGTENVTEGTGNREQKGQSAEGKQRWLVWGVVAATACAVIGLSGFYLGKKVPTRSSASVAINVPAPAATVVEGAMPPNENVTTLERDKNNLETQLMDLRTKLTDAKADQDSLRKELSAADDKLASFQRSQAASQDSVKEVQESKSQVALLASETERLRQRLAESDTKLALQKRTTEEISQKLQVTEANLQEELSNKDAKSQMGELVAARNLHIVDVYDADPTGKRQRAFGRVFYTEGKSLVFYAYDLEGAGQMKANVVFHVWGGKSGVKEVTHSLGILHKDDEGEGRWKMSFDDPGVLAQINSVFVTAEASNKHYDEPHGKKVLFAYFGSQPNHP